MNKEREKISFDVLFVGGGPACLAGAIKLMRLAEKKNISLDVALIEKGADIGSNALSGAILNPVALKELIPDFMEKGCPVEAIVKEDEFYFLTGTKHYRIPFTPKYMRNKGFCIISLSRFTKWLAGIAEGLGVNIFPGFAGNEVLYALDQKTVTGVRTGDKGIGKDGLPKGNFEPGIDLSAKITLFGEGAKGSLMQDIIKKFNIYSGKMPQVFETGIKEVIQLPENNYFTTGKGNDIHMFGYPLDFFNTPGGGFVYEMDDNKAAIGFIIGLSYDNPMLDLYEEFIKFKRHPFVSKIIAGGKVIEQGARTVSTGGYYTIPKLAIDGGMFIGGNAAMQNTPGLKGIHLSMKSGMLAAEASIKAFEKNDFSRKSLNHYSKLFEKSWAKEEIFEGRNFSQALSKKGPVKLIHLGAQHFTKGRGVCDSMPVEEDYKTLKAVDGGIKDGGIKDLALTDSDKKAFDDVLYVDKLTGVYLSRTMHREDQPCHILVHDKNLCVTDCFKTYRCPCTRFCPGNVYEIKTDEKTSQKKLQLNPSNCLHCKTCSVKDPYENITWTCPEGGDGPGYMIL